MKHLASSLQAQGKFKAKLLTLSFFPQFPLRVRSYMVTPSPPPTGRQIAGLNFAAVLARRQEFPPPPDASSAANTKPVHPPSFSLSQMKKAALAPPNPSSFLAATRSSAPRVPRDLAFGVLYKDYICRESNPLMEEVSLSSGMRHVDQLRNHPLQQEEQVSYNIPQSMQRCLVTLPKNVLMLCKICIFNALVYPTFVLPPLAE